MQDIVGILDGMHTFEWDKTHLEPDDLLHGQVFEPDIWINGLYDLDEGLDGCLDIHAHFASWQCDITGDADGWVSTHSVPSPYLMTQLIETLVTAGYEVEDGGGPNDRGTVLTVHLKPSDAGPLWTRYRECHMDKAWTRFGYYPQYVLQLRRERRRLAIVFGFFRHLMCLARFKRELMEKACHPRRLAEIGMMVDVCSE